jgi:integrase
LISSAAEVANGFPTFAQGREEYLDYAKLYVSEASLDSYRTSLCHPKVKAALDEWRLPTITRDDVMEIVLDVHAVHERTTELVISAIRPMFNWLGEDGRRKRYGVEPGIMVPLKLPKRKVALVTSIDEDDDEQPWSADYVPEISELGRIIAVARSGIIQPIPAGAVELVCWNVQRRRAIATARLQDFFDLGNGTGLWRIPAISPKGKAKRPQTIPLPPVIWACVKKAPAVAVAKNKTTKYLFPGARPRRKGMAVTHMSPSTVGQLFADIPDCGAMMHDVRRTMGTHGEQLIGFSRLDAGFIMDHEESVKQFNRITSRTAGTGTNDFTGVHYSLHDGSHHSWPVMRAWADAVERAVAEATAALDLKQLAREFGDPLYRIGAKPWGWTVATTPEELAAVDAREKAI